MCVDNIINMTSWFLRNFIYIYIYITQQQKINKKIKNDMRMWEKERESIFLGSEAKIRRRVFNFFVWKVIYMYL